LRSTLSACYHDRPFTLVFGAMRDKAIGEIAEILFSLADRVFATRADNPRSASPEEVRGAARRITADITLTSDVPSALNQASDAVDTGGIVVITGSIYIVGEAIQALGMRI
jgi:dihydrofolate synthase/folylpolyglutamate synthase